MATIAGSDANRDARGRLRYTSVAILLHWLIAAMILYNLASGLLRSSLPGGFFAFHISSGITILALTVVRVAWRFTHRPPPFLPMNGWEARMAHGVHFLLYLAMLLMPFSGWALISANPPLGSAGQQWSLTNPAPGETPPPARPAIRPDGQPIVPPRLKPRMIWSVIPLPLIGPVNEVGRTPAGVPEQRALHERIETFHSVGGWVMLALLVLHIAGALKHQFIDRERELARMGIGRS